MNSEEIFNYLLKDNTYLNEEIIHILMKKTIYYYLNLLNIILLVL